MTKPIRVLIIDDSASARQALAHIFSEDPDFEVMEPASDPFVAAKRSQTQVPDVITLDVEMPRMGGVTFLRKQMAQRLTPVVMYSSLTEEGSQTLMQALEAGAVDIILKPKPDAGQQLQDAKLRICDVVKGAARARIRQISARAFSGDPPKKLSADVMLAPPSPNCAMARTTEMVVCIGASTGGTESLRVVLEALPAASVDVLFRSAARSAARSAGVNAMAVIMIGMGDDGARGLLEMHKAGAQTVAQDEASSVAFGMPKEAIALCAADKILPLEQLAAEVARVGRRYMSGAA